MLVNYAFEQRSSQRIPPAWVTKTMLQANAPPQVILDVLLALLDTRVSLQAWWLCTTAHSPLSP